MWGACRKEVRATELRLGFQPGLSRNLDDLPDGELELVKCACAALLSYAEFARLCQMNTAATLRCCASAVRAPASCISCLLLVIIDFRYSTRRAPISSQAYKQALGTTAKCRNVSTC